MQSIQTELKKTMQQYSVTPKDPTCSIWLRSQLSALLEHHMAYKCPILHYGTVLYRYGGDLIHALSVSLGQAKMQSSSHNRKTLVKHLLRRVQNLMQSVMLQLRP